MNNRWLQGLLALAFAAGLSTVGVPAAAQPADSPGDESSSRTSTVTSGPSAKSSADESAPKPPPGYEAFEPAPDAEQVSATNLVVLAYGAVLFGLFAYVVFIVVRQASISDEMTRLARRLDRFDDK